MTLRELCVDQPDMVDTDTALSAQFTTEEGNRIILDSGATRHTVSQPCHFIGMEDLDNPITMLTATGQAIKVNKIGTVRISPGVRIGEVAVVPQARTNLMSVSRDSRAGFCVLFEGHQATVQTHTGKVKLVFKLEDGLYVRDITPNGTSNKPQTKRTVGFQVNPVNKPFSQPVPKSSVSTGAQAAEQKQPTAATSSKPADKMVKGSQPSHHGNNGSQLKVTAKKPTPATKKPATAASSYERMYHMTEVKNDTDTANTDTALTAATY